jgi:hypothetical protein
MKMITDDLLGANVTSIPDPWILVEFLFRSPHLLQPIPKMPDTLQDIPFLPVSQDIPQVSQHIIPKGNPDTLETLHPHRQ